jgi:exopolysaccharide biosynthesis polyprenyl glycosylphosphotransferase
MSISSLRNLAKENLKNRNSISFFLLFLPDFCAISLSAITAYGFRFPSKVNDHKTLPAIAQFDYRGILIGIVAAWMVVLVITGSYRPLHSNLVVFNLRLLIKSSLIFFLLLGFLSFILRASFSRTVFLVMLGSGLIYLFIFRILIYRLILSPLILKKQVTSNLMIIGRTRLDLQSHSDWLIKNRSFGFSVVSRLECKEITKEWIEEFDRILHFLEIEEILLLPGMETDSNFSRFIHYCEDLNLHVNWIPLDSGNLGYWLIPSQQEGIPFLTFEKSEITPLWRVAKRLFDLLFSVVFIVLFSPIYLAIAIAILLTSGGPVIYKQKRVGLRGKSFNFYKFRSMVQGADEKVGEIVNKHGTSHVLFKNEEDPRITPLGRFLRKYSLDELPQFFNVLNNTMSVVGPRPALPREVNVYNSIYERRLNSKPGITGPWQISGRSDLDLKTSVALDLNYLTNWSFTRDLWIIFSTVGAVLKKKGAY